MEEKKSKYNAKKVEFAGHVFDSKDKIECLQILQRKYSMGEIVGVTIKPVYILQDSFFSGAEKIRKVKYSADFVVEWADGTIEVIDVKTTATPKEELMRILFLKKFPALKLTWLCRSEKHGNADGLIDYFKLKRIRREKK
jgi:hypothetical protein